MFFAKNISKANIFVAVLAMFSGGTIYIFLRSSDLVFFQWFQAIGLDHWFNSARYSAHYMNVIIPEWIIYSLPNGLWAFAYALLISGIWSGSKSWLRYIWISSIPVLVIGFELLQLAGIIRGTFCMQDLFFGITGLVLGIIVGFRIIKSKKYEKVPG